MMSILCACAVHVLSGVQMRGGGETPPNNLITIVKLVPNCVNLRIKVNYSFYRPCFTRFIPNIYVEKEKPLNYGVIIRRNWFELTRSWKVALSMLAFVRFCSEFGFFKF